MPPQFERLRFPVALVLVLIAVIVLWPRGSSSPAAGSASPSPTVVAGDPGGEVVGPTPTPAPPSPIPTATPAATPAPTAEPTEAPPPAQDGFTADVLACRAINGSNCDGQLGTLPPSVSSFTALVVFRDASAGDQLNAVLDGPSGTIAGTPYALQGSGDGYFWAEFQVGGLPGGEYTLTALRNGEQVATTGFRKAGG